MQFGGSFERKGDVTYAYTTPVTPIAYEITDEAVWIAPSIEELELVTWGR